MMSDRSSQRAFLGTSALLFAGSIAVTIAWCRSMSPTEGMAMPGGWTMSMAWMKMPDQTWAGATLLFGGMWLIMMAAMMLPSLVPMLSRYREAVRLSAGRRLGFLTALTGLGYFSIWGLIGLAIFPTAIAFSAAEMRFPEAARAVPLLTGAVILVAGLIQFTTWKIRYLDCCREMPEAGSLLSGDSSTAFRTGLSFGIHCSLSCANLTAILVAAGVMDLRLMGLVTAAITAERLLPAGERIARSIGIVAILAGIVTMARAVLL
jgi:predicted metal-binding membrane protein